MNRLGYMKVAGAVPELRVADCLFNAQQIAVEVEKAAKRGSEVILLPELSISGASCGDLFLQPKLLLQAEESLKWLISRCAEYPIAAVVGMPIRVGSSLYNAAVLFSEGEILGVVPKCNIDSLTEGRWFSSGCDVRESSMLLCEQEVPFGRDLIFKINGVEIGVEIGGDSYAPIPPSAHLATAGAKIILHPSAERALSTHFDFVKESIKNLSQRLLCGYLHVSAGGGESTTDFVYGGEIVIVDKGDSLAEGTRFSLKSEMVVADIDVEQLSTERVRSSLFRGAESESEFSICECDFNPNPGEFTRKIDPTPFIPHCKEELKRRCEEIIKIQCAALAKRLKHTSCKSVIVGVSGGLDSTLALLVAVETFDKLGWSREGIYGITMPGFGTSGRTYRNALDLMTQLGITQHEISIVKAVSQHFEDIGLSADDRSATYENSQARERTQILMDYANKVGGLVIGTGDLSELALGWATYNGDHMSMYGLNGSIPKTLVRSLVRHIAESMGGKVCSTLLDIVDTPVSPELLPTNEKGDIAQKTEDLVGPYELHDFMLYNFIRRGHTPERLLWMAYNAFDGKYSHEEILKWMRVFFSRFFSQQFKRSALPDGPKVGSVSLSPRGDFMMPSDANATAWLQEIELLSKQ